MAIAEVRLSNESLPTCLANLRVSATADAFVVIPACGQMYHEDIRSKRNIDCRF